MKAAVIGCGTIAPAHLASLTRLGVDVVGVCDTDSQRAARVAAAFGVKWSHAEAAELLDRHRPDVVHVLTPPQTHREIAIEAMHAGSHVLVEKPMAVDVAEADQMIEEARRSGRTLTPCHNLLFDPAVLEARALVATGAVGEVVSVETTQTLGGRERDRYVNTPWIRGLSGGVIHELAPHGVYLQQELLGPLEVVCAAATMQATAPSPSPDFRAVFQSDSRLGSAAISLSARPRHHVLRIYGTAMTLHVDLRDHLLVKLRRASTGGHARRALSHVGLGMQLAGRAATSTLAGIRQPWHRGHSTLIRRFYEALREGGSSPVTAEDGRAVVSVLDRLWETLGLATTEPAL